MHMNILGHLRDAVTRKCHENWRTNSWFPLHDNAPAHRSIWVKDFLSKNDLTTLQHPTYIPDLAAAALYLPSTEISIEGTALV